MEQQHLQKLIKAGRRRPLWTPTEGVVRVEHGPEAVRRILQHRPPFLFVDGVTEVDLPGRAARGHRRVDPDDPVFRGHFPGEPIYPGVLLVETMGQLAVCLLYFQRSGTTSVSPVASPERVRALKIHHAVITGEVWPGDELTIVAQVVGSDELMATCAGQILRRDTICAFAVLEVFFVGE